MDYEKAWNNLKTELNNKIEYHKTGEMQSILESCIGETITKEVLKVMTDIEQEELCHEQ